MRTRNYRIGRDRPARPERPESGPLSLRDLVVMNLAFIMPTIPYLLYSDIVKAAHGASAAAFWFAALTVGLTVFNFIKIARSYPGGASVYHFIAEGAHRNAGFVASWALFLFYLSVPVTALILSAQLISKTSGVPFLLVIIAFAVFAFAVNYIGPRIAAKVCLVCLCIVIAFTIIYILVCVLAVGKGAGVGHVVSSVPYKGSGAGFGSAFLGGGVVLLAFLGFDSSNTLAAEAEHDRNIIPRSFVITCVIAGLFIFLQLYVSGLIVRYSQETADLTLIDIALKAGGKTLMVLYSTGIIIACLLAVTAGQSAAARLLFALGRAGALPKHIFARRDAKPDPRRRVPLINLLMVSLLTLLLCALSSQLPLLIGISRFMGAFVLLAVNVTMLLHGFFAKNDHNIVTALIVPALGIFGSLAAWIGVTPKQFLFGILWLVIGAVLSGIIPGTHEHGDAIGRGAGGHDIDNAGSRSASGLSRHGSDGVTSKDDRPHRKENEGPGFGRREKREKDILSDKSFRLPPSRDRRF